MTLRHAFGLEDAAKRVENAVRAALASGVRTADIMQPGMKLVGTRAMGDAVAAQI
jgi:3-isopropylmalate dehydrogenase